MTPDEYRAALEEALKPLLERLDAADAVLENCGLGVMP